MTELQITKAKELNIIFKKVGFEEKPYKSLYIMDAAKRSDETYFEMAITEDTLKL